MSTVRFCLLTLLAFHAGGCSTMSIADCTGRDWFAVGYQDAQLGLGTERFLDYHTSCAQHGITPQRTRYLTGWVEGRGTAAET